MRRLDAGALRAALDRLGGPGLRYIRFVRRELIWQTIDAETGEVLGWWFAGEEETLESLIALLMERATEKDGRGRG